MTITEIISNTIKTKSTDDIEGKNIFDPNNYTESKNPILAELALILFNGTDLGNNSDAVCAIQDKNTISDRFYRSLNDKQSDLYDEMFDSWSEEHSIVERERFILGFKLASMLFKEGFII